MCAPQGGTRAAHLTALAHGRPDESMCPVTVTTTPPSPPATQNTQLDPHRSPASSLGCACTCKISPTVLTRNCARAHRWRTYMCAHAVAIQPSRPPTLSLSLSLSLSLTHTHRGSVLATAIQSCAASPGKRASDGWEPSACPGAGVRSVRNSRTPRRTNIHTRAARTFAPARTARTSDARTS